MRQTRRALLDYGITLAAVGAAFVGRWLLDPILGDGVPFAAFFFAIAVGAWRGGLRPGLLATGLCLVLAWYFFLPPRFTFVNTDPARYVGLGLYLFVGITISALGEAVRIVQARSVRAQRSARQQEQLLRLTLASIGDAVITTGNDGRITYLNHVAETVTGWTQAEAVGRPVETVFRLVDEKSGEVAKDPVATALARGTGTGLADPAVLISKDGARIPIEDRATPIQDDRGEVSGCVLIFRDVSERRRLEEESAAQFLRDRFLASIVASSDDAILSKSLDGTIRSWNEGAERLFGYTPEEAVGRHVSLIIPPERINEEEQIIARLRSGQRVDHFDTIRRTKDGRMVNVSLTISPIKDASGHVVGASKIARDITLQKVAEERINRLVEDLKEVDHRKDNFLATLAHELRGPLAPLRNLLEVLKRSESDPGHLRQAREGMERQLSQLVRLVDDLLDMSRITRNRFDLRKEQVELASVLRQAAETCRPLAERARHEVTLTLPQEPIHLDGDPVRLLQIFGNLLNNACRYTPNGGRIRVSAERQGGEVLVSVKDNGLGIPQDMLQRIFEMFTQVERKVELWPGGLGIGLNLVKQLVEMHAGSVQAYSEGPGNGSEFVVRLPILAGQPKSRDLAQPPTPVSTPRRVLVVDDNPDSADSLAVLLEITGNEIRTAHDGVEAFETAQGFRPDIVLLDIGLPKLNGHEVCRRIRETTWGKEMVLVALTGWGQEEDRRKSKEAGFDHHLVKPVEYSELMKLLAGVRSK